MSVTLTNDMINGAKETEKMIGVPTSITLAQIQLESSGKYSGGLSYLGSKYNNLFGVKANGATTNKVNLPTTEYSNGKQITQNAYFKTYNSQYDSIIDHANLLKNDRYVNAFKNAKSVEDYANGLVNAGYATDPNYAKQLLNIIEKNNYIKYDSGDYTFDNSNATQVTANEKSSTVSNVIKFVTILLVSIIGIFMIFKTLGVTDVKQSIVKKLVGG